MFVSRLRKRKVMGAEFRRDGSLLPFLNHQARVAAAIYGGEGVNIPLMFMPTQAGGGHYAFGARIGADTLPVAGCHSQQPRGAPLRQPAGWRIVTWDVSYFWITRSNRH